MLIAIEGNMGAGKTTLINELCRILKARLLPEPIDSPTFSVLLERYYQSPQRWGMTFQLDTIRARAIAQRLAGPGVALQDRSVIGDHIFAQVAHSQGFMDGTEYAVYEQLREALLFGLPAPDLVLYLRASPETCSQRIGLRARGCEHGIPFDYLRALHDAHERMAEKLGSRCLTLPWEQFKSPTLVAQFISERLGDKLQDAISNRRKTPRRHIA